MKASELTDIALDWAVAKCELIQHLTSLGKTPNYEQCDSIALSKTRLGIGYSTNWAQGGPIIEREKINVSMSLTAPWMGFLYDGAEMIWLMDGPTPLIAAMRCYVSSKLGDEIDVPEELL